jgi:two-component sensor histidine kinase
MIKFTLFNLLFFQDQNEAKNQCLGRKMNEIYCPDGPVGLKKMDALAGFSAFALAEADFQSVLERSADIAAEILDVPLTKILQFADSADHLVLQAGVGWAEGAMGKVTVGTDLASQAGYTLMSRDPVIVLDLLAETRFNGPRLLHDYGVRSGISVVIPGVGIRPFGVFGVHTRSVRRFSSSDAQFLQTLANIVAASARQAAAAGYQTSLAREMAHRAGNMLQLVNSIATQTFRQGADMAVAGRSFSDRLGALSRANHVVAKTGWAPTRFRDLLDETLQPFGERIKAEGRDILLPPELCFDLGLVLHELVSNAIRYGSLGRDGGFITVRWATRTETDSGAVFRFEWNDLSSATSEPADHPGLGSRMISALVQKKWAGTISSQHEPAYKLMLEIPLQ